MWLIDYNTPDNSLLSGNIKHNHNIIMIIIIAPAHREL